MMKTSIFLLIILQLSKYAYSQNFDSSTNKLLLKESQNYIDSLGLKQGFWVEYKTVNVIRFQYGRQMEDAHTAQYRVAAGKYLNNNKVGIWEYYKDQGCYIETIKTINYLEDGSLEEWKYESTCFTYFSPDSVVVNSKIFLYRDTILINCENKLTCLATVHGKELVKFDFIDLDYEQFRMYLGEYQRQILWFREEK